MMMMMMTIGISFTYALIVWLCKESECLFLYTLASPGDVTRYVPTPLLLMTWVGPEKAPSTYEPF